MKRKFLVAVCLLMVFCLLPMEGMALRLGQVVRITNGGSINVRKGPSTDYNSIGTAKPDYIYIYLGTENNWHKIVYDDKVGYVSGNKSAVEAGLVPDEYTDGPKAEANVRITHNATLNIRKGPSKDTKVIGTAHPNDIYPYLSPANGWYAIQLSDGQTGYVAANRSQVEFLGVYDENGNFTSVTPTPSPTPKPTPKPTATPVPTLAPTPIPTVVPTLVPIVTAVPTAYYPTATPVPPFMPQGSVPCQHCGSTGVCITCNGFGAVYTYGQTSLAYCPTCYGNGRCLHCSGSGRQAVSW